jgi:hypothetical protein
MTRFVPPDPDCCVTDNADYLCDKCKAKLKKSKERKMRKGRPDPGKGKDEPDDSDESDDDDMEANVGRLSQADLDAIQNMHVADDDDDDQSDLDRVVNTHREASRKSQRFYAGQPSTVVTNVEDRHSEMDTPPIDWAAVSESNNTEQVLNRQLARSNRNSSSESESSEVVADLPINFQEWSDSNRSELAVNRGSTATDPLVAGFWGED